MTFFTASDFRLPDISNETAAAEQANAKLERDAKVVYGWPTNSIPEDKLWCDNRKAYDDVATYRGLLICVEEIVKLKCEHAGHIIAVGKGIFRCADCKSEIKPTGLEVVDEQR